MRGRIFSAIISLVVVTLWASQVRAELTYSAGVTSSGVRFLLVHGDFEAGDDVLEFSRFVAASNPEVVTFNSPGGAIYKAMEIGRAIRFHGLTTFQPKANECASACSLAFLGGRTRIAEAGSIGVHKSFFGGGSRMSADNAVSSVQQVTADIIGYIREMGADPALLELSLRYESWDVRYLSASEMAQYRITTTASSPAISSDRPTTALSPAISSGKPTTALLPEPREQASATKPNIPLARSGRVLHPKGRVFLRSADSEESPVLGEIPNGYSVKILDVGKRWYRVQVGSQVGYLHHTWVRVDQFVSAPIGHRYIQIASFEEWSGVERYLRYTSLPMSVYLASNGWYAVTLADTFDLEHGVGLVRQLKSEQRIPDDSFLTLGNTYAVKLK